MIESLRRGERGLTIVAGFLVAITLHPPVPAEAQSKAAMSGVDRFKLRTISDLRLSPDGRRVAYTVTGLPPDQSLDELWSVIRIASVDGRGDRALTSPRYSARSPQWSPDGRRLGYLARQSGRDDVWVVPAAGEPPRRVTSAPTSVSSFAWSPDGSRIAFVMPDPGNATVSARQQLVRLASDTAPPARLWVVPIGAPAEAKPVTQAPLNVLSRPNWSPDGASIAFVHSASTTLADVFSPSVSVIDLATRKATLLRSAGLQATSPFFSPDGKWVAFRAATRRSVGPVDAAFYVVSADGTTEQCLGPADDHSEMAAWTTDGTGIIVTDQVGTTRRVRRLSVSGSPGADLYHGPLVVTNLDVSADGLVVAFAGESLATPPELYVSPLTTIVPRPITRLNTGLTAPPFGATEVVRWKSTDSITVEGLLTHPAGYSTSTRVPLLVVAHAGGETFSQSYIGNPFDGSNMVYPPSLFSARGYAVLRVNQRGGGLSGYGFEAFLPVFKPKEKANQDILAGVDHLVRMGIADSGRVAIMGWSNGGLVTASLITSSDRFAAASILAGFPDLVLESGLNPWIDPDLGATPWADPARYVKHSPMFGLQRTRAATLVIHGADDGIPVGEARSFYAGLRKVGVTAELAIYPGMGQLPPDPGR